MDLLKNPFHILGATQRDDRQRIMELEEKQSLLSDPDACVAARTVLINPRNRISAEVAWLPGVNPGHIESVLKQLDSPNQNLLNIIGLSAIASANVFTAGLSRISNIESSELMKWTLAIVHVYEKIDVVEVSDILNEERNYSRFPQIADLSVITDGIQKQRDYYIDTLSSAINNLSVNERASILNLILEETKDKSNYNYPELINKLIESYEKEVKNDLEKKQRIIEALDEKIRAMVDANSPDSELEPIVNQLIEAVKDWDTIAQPIQLSKRSRGERHTASFKIAWQVRSLALDLFRDYKRSGKSLLNTLKDIFAEVPEVRERIIEDLRELKNFEKFEEINTRIEKLKVAADNHQPDYTLSYLVNQLIDTVKSWDSITQSFEANEVVVYSVRSIGLHLCNEHQKLDYAIQITTCLIDLFEGVNRMEEVNNKLNRDLLTLFAMKERRSRKGSSGCLLQIVIFFGLGLIGAFLQGC